MPRQKITMPASDDVAELAAELPDLTAQQSKFVQAILSGTAVTAAYKSAYDCSKMLPNSVMCAASKLYHDAKIGQWLYAARTACLSTGAVSLENHLSELSRLKELAISSGNIGAAVQAEQLRGKAQGHYVEQIRDVTDYDPLETLRSIAAIAGNETAERLAQANGIPWVAPAAQDRKSLN